MARRPTHTAHAVTRVATYTLKNDKPHDLAPTINNIAGSEHVPHAPQKVNSQYHPALASMGLTVINYLTQNASIAETYTGTLS